MSNDKKNTPTPQEETPLTNRDIGTSIATEDYSEYIHRQPEVVNTLPPPPPITKRNGNNDGNT